MTTVMIRDLPRKLIEAILHEAMRRDMTTARRTILLQILWNERYLTRAQLIARVEYSLGKGCFGSSAWEDTFYRDIRMVKHTFQAENQSLEYSRSKQRNGYYLKGQPALSPEFQQMIKSSVGEVDPRQMDIYQSLSPADRFRQGCVISDTARKVVAYRIQQENPNLTLQEANRMALQRVYSA